MAQIIRLRRGTLAELNSVTLSNGELGVVTSSVSNIGDAVLKTAIVAGHSDGTNRLSIGRLVQGSGSATLVGITGGAAFNDMLYYDTNDYKLQTLHTTNGVTTLNLTGNISATEIAGNISGSYTSTGSFGYLNVVGDAVIGGNLTFGDADTDYVSFAADISSSLIPDASDTYNLGSDSQRWNDLYLSGSISASGGPHHIISATTIDLDAEGALTIDGGSITIGGDSDVAFDIDTSTLDIDSSGAITIDSTAGISLDAGAASNFSTSAGALTLQAQENGLNLVGNITASANISGSVSSSIQIGGSITASAANIPLLNSDSTITIDGVTGVTIQENGTDVIAIDTNQDVLFSRTGGATGDPDVEFDGYVRHDGQVEVANTTTSTTTSTGALVVDGGAGIAENVNVGGNLTVTGDYTVNGTTTFISSSTLTIGDNIIVVNAVSPVRYGGIQVRDIIGTTNTGSMVWDSSNDYWVAGQSGSEYRVPVQAAVTDLTENKPVIVDGNGRLESSANITDDGSTVDFGDVNLTSIDKLEGVDTNTYIDLGGSTLIVTKGTLQPSANGGNDLGATGTRYANLWLSSNADVDGYLTVAGAITGSTHISASGNLYMTGNTDLDGTLDVAGLSDFQSRVDAQQSLQVTGSLYVSAGASVAATSASLVSFRNDGTTQFGYLTSANTEAITAGLIAYNASTGNLTVSSLIDGGSF